MFSGKSKHGLDDKNRVCIPKRFQNELGRNAEGHMEVILTRGTDGCLFLFSREGWKRIQERMALQPFGSPHLRGMQRVFLASTVETRLDGSGRLVLPEEQRELAGIQNEVVLVGVGDRAEVWSPERWEAFESGFSESFDEFCGILMDGAEPPGQGAQIG
ncbi:MAG TPA: division/cell wall cluster transcriptional repressor MraZ [Planctomycetes bacterium]|nr:division/cell wall cluster transcriptional repressor MraZ [Planctomycetota bacterium]